MYILQNEDANELYCFIRSATSFTVTHVRKSGLTKVVSSGGRYSLNLWAELKDAGWVELERPVSEEDENLDTMCDEDYQGLTY